MIGSNRGLEVLALAEPCDMRKSYDSLSAVVRKELGRNPNSGTLYLFCNKRRTRAKVLMFDGTGLCIYMKRLEKGRFAPLWGVGAQLEPGATAPRSRFGITSPLAPISVCRDRASG